MFFSIRHYINSDYLIFIYDIPLIGDKKSQKLYYHMKIVRIGCIQNANYFLS
jgi:hypothetical protein